MDHNKFSSGNKTHQPGKSPPDLKKEYFDDASVENSLANLGWQLPPNPNTNGRKLVENIFSYRVFTFDEDVVIAQDQEKKDLNYMKKVIHRIGSKYDFIDTTSVFFIEWDSTLAVEYNDDRYRIQRLCNTEANKQ